MSKTETYGTIVILTIEEDNLEEALRSSLSLRETQRASLIKNTKGIVLKNRWGDVGVHVSRLDQFTKQELKRLRSSKN